MEEADIFNDPTVGVDQTSYTDVCPDLKAQIEETVTSKNTEIKEEKKDKKAPKVQIMKSSKMSKDDYIAEIIKTGKYSFDMLKDFNLTKIKKIHSEVTATPVTTTPAENSTGQANPFTEIDEMTANQFFYLNVTLANILEKTVPSIDGYSTNVLSNKPALIKQFKELIAWERKNGNNLAVDPRLGFVITNGAMIAQSYVSNKQKKTEKTGNSKE